MTNTINDLPTRSFRRDFKDRIVVAKVNFERGYVSVTGEVYGPATLRGEPKLVNKVTKRTMWMHSGGCCHDEVVASFPWLADLVRFHLTDLSALPMHYVANAVHWAEYLAGCSAWERKPYDPNPADAFKNTVVLMPGEVPPFAELTCPPQAFESVDPVGFHRRHVRRVVTEWCEARLPVLRNRLDVVLKEYADRAKEETMP